jgi:hypothetical protein
MGSPDSSLPAAIAAYSGAWEGSWSGGAPSALIVRSISATGASAAYVQKDAVEYFLNLDVLPDGTLLQLQPGVRLLWAVSPDLKSLSGTRTEGGSIDRITMTRCLLPPNMLPSPTPTMVPADCEPTNQDVFVYLPTRLQVLSRCVRVTGRVSATSLSPDGDGIIHLKLDAQFERFLREPEPFPGSLVLEIVCFGAVTDLPSTVALCDSDPNPLRAPLPKVGQRIWAEGRWVLDLGHQGHGELHPVYRWGFLE